MKTAIIQLIESFRFEEEGVLVTASKDAEKYVTEIENASKLKASEDESLLSEVLRRRAEQVWRISLCIHLARYGNMSGTRQLSIEDAQVAEQIANQFTRIVAKS